MSGLIHSANGSERSRLRPRDFSSYLSPDLSPVSGRAQLKGSAHSAEALS
jgi:hypothetical protein